MSEPDGREVPPRGLARSIDALFRPTSQQEAWETVADRPPDPADPADPSGPDPDGFLAAVESFVRCDPRDRAGPGRDLPALGVALREAGRLDPLADGVERLALAAGDPPDPALAAAARQLVTPGVASRIAVRIGAAEEEARRDELTRVCAVVGHEMVLALLDALTDAGDRGGRPRLVRALAAMGSDALAVLEQTMETGRAFQLRNAVAVLGEMGGDRARELVSTTLSHPDAEVRRASLLALARTGGEEAGVLIHGLLEDGDARVRAAAALAAGTLGGERAVRPLVGLLEAEEDEEVVRAVLGALGQLGDPGAVPAVEKRAVGSFFSRPSNEVRIAAYRTLHRIGTPHAMRLLEQAREDKDPEVRTFARKLLSGEL